MTGQQDALAAAVVADADGVVSGWSEGATLLQGWTAADTVGRPVAELLTDPVPPGFPADQGVGPDPTGFVPLRHRDGSTLDAVVAVHPPCTAATAGRWATS
ncbi:PAS domain-containing protein [Streptomyces scabiei]|uniref:PAS domain-containing protein n=1 Tax=Streptomyces scabiei TaxID=1930 RepID=UPI0038F5FFE7